MWLPAFTCCLQVQAMVSMWRELLLIKELGIGGLELGLGVGIRCWELGLEII